MLNLNKQKIMKAKQKIHKCDMYIFLVNWKDLKYSHGSEVACLSFLFSVSPAVKTEGQSGWFSEQAGFWPGL